MDAHSGCCHRCYECDPISRVRVKCRDCGREVDDEGKLIGTTQCFNCWTERGWQETGDVRTRDIPAR